MGKVITKGALVDLAASLAGVTGSLVGADNYDVNAVLTILEYLMVHLEEQYGIFLGFKKSEYQKPKVTSDSGINDTDALSVATLLAHKAHAIFGIDPVTYNRLELQSYGMINRLTPVQHEALMNNEQLPTGAGNNHCDGVRGGQYFRRTDKIDVEDDSTLDLGIPYTLNDS